MSSLNTDLFELIHKLDKNERRYFKLYIKNLGAKANTYSKLFDAIAKQTVYDEEAIKKQFRRERFVHKLSATKRYLLDTIMRALLNHHADKGIDNIILDGIRSFKILLKKGLFLFLIKEIYRLEKLAREHDRFFYLPIILCWKCLAKVVVSTNEDSAIYKQEIEDFLESADYLNLCVQQIAEHQKSRFHWRKHGVARADMIDLPPQTKRFAEKMAYLMRRADETYYKHQLDESLEIRLELLKLYTGDEVVLTDEENFNNYLVHLINVMSSACYKPAVETFYEVYRQYEQIDFARIPDRSKIHIWDLEVRFYRKIGAIDKARTSFAAFTAFIEKQPQLIANQYIPTIYFEMGLVCLLSNECDLALEHLRKARQLTKSLKDYPNLIYTIDLIELLVFYEKEEWLLLPNLLRSYYRKLKKEDEFFVFGQLMHKLLKELIKTDDKLEKKAVLEKGKTALIDFKGNTKTNIFIFFPYEKWMEALLENKSLLAIVQADYQGK